MANLNHDEAVDLADLTLCVNDWLLEKVLMAADFDRDNDIDMEDVAIFAAQWMEGG